MQTSTPDNGGYMIAAYLIVAALVLGYAWSLARRAKKAAGE
jgi:CcmD family protein